MPFVKDGQLDGSMARMRTSFPAALSARNGKASPEKFDPPPWQPMTTSGYSPASFICSFASCPMTVWCRSTWFKTLPRAYFASSWVAASSTASEMAMPRLPGLRGSCSRIFRPDRVRSEGDGITSAPHRCIMLLRYGFCW